MERLTFVPAKVVNGIVNILYQGEYVPADDIILQGAGGADSTGMAIIGEAISLYFVNTQPDVQILIDKIIETIDETVNIANQLVVKVPNTPAVVLDADAALALGTIKTELENFKLV